MTLRRSLPFWNTGKRGVFSGYTPLVDTSTEGFGFLNLYDQQPNSFEITREGNNPLNIPWNGELPNESDIDAYIAVNPSVDYFLTSIYEQKNPSYSIINLLSGQNHIFLFDEFGNNRHALRAKDNAGGSGIFISGSSNIKLAKNTPYFAATLLVRGTSIKSLFTDQNIFYISTHTNASRVKCGIYFQPNPANGIVVGGRRLSSDGFTSVTSTHDASQWSVITGIFDFENRELILRANGVEQSKNTAFGSGGLSENTNPLTQSVFTNISGNSFASCVFWNDRPINAAEIEDVEIRMMNFANITP